ncbi:MAG TPA: hypothetical protein VEF76_11815 [Patescibacteria group bacterium]|nr:hypothetical protein [Patescibacteria group bacterium]
MATSINKGFVRAGVLLSIIWLLAVGGYAYAEGQRHDADCALSRDLHGCHYHFWAWVVPNEGAPVSKPRKDEPPEERLKRALVNTLADVIEEVTPREFRLQPDRLLLWMFAPLGLLWGLGFGLCWVAQGFRQGQAKP